MKTHQNKLHLLSFDTDTRFNMCMFSILNSQPIKLVMHCFCTADKHGSGQNMSRITNHTFPEGTNEDSLYEDWIQMSYKGRQLPDFYLHADYAKSSSVSVCFSTKPSFSKLRLMLMRSSPTNNKIQLNILPQMFSHTTLTATK